ncbi:MAG TPA: prolyl oligopeptidase family serine peptidase [Pyrinomonadaceae bacterium]|jgi:dipeptidyl aminopeptidase/acylaminoacyl peptidase|nr:prolyl oligopeptidase family serine peptidase [Pyrinomonadaceae bacterium]
MRISRAGLVVFLTLIFTAIVTSVSFSNAHPAVHPVQSFTMEQIKSYPFPNELAASATGSRISWAFNERGLRNVWVAEGPDFKTRRLTDYNADDGQELTSLSLSADGKYVVYVRGGDHGSNFDSSVGVNPALAAVQTKVQIWSVAFAGGEPKLLGEGDEPVISPKNDRVAFLKDRGIWFVPVDGSTPAKRLFFARGECGSPEWSPDGTRLGFVSNRGDHSFVGIYTNDSTPIVYLAPSTARDASPRWSPDGKRIVFVRRPGSGGAPEPILEQQAQAWSIWIADTATGEGRQLWKSPFTLRGSPPSTHGGTNLYWAAAGRIVFLSYLDGWPHLYSISETGGEPLLLTRDNYMAEYISISSDRRYMVFAGNAGTDIDDIDRRHIVKVPVDKAEPIVMTPGKGLEWTPFVTGDGQYIAYLAATAQRPPLPTVIPAVGGKPITLAEDRLPADFPSTQLVMPKKVVYKAPDGIDIHAQLFEPASGAAKKPAIIYVHGGPPRQMLLGWHYSDYYSNAYAQNQFLASRGYIVLSVNYRLGIGYGHDFHRPLNAGVQGASEYQDVKAGAEYLQRLPQVDAKRVGIYGGSYGGYLTALALARDSKLFAAGVDIHGVHNWNAERAAPLLENRYEKPPDVQRALDVAWQSSPVSAIATWKSPVLLIHGDDDRNVRFSQTTDLVRRLEKAGVSFEELVIPDDTHHFMRHANIVKVNIATASFFDRIFGMNRGSE